MKNLIYSLIFITLLIPGKALWSQKTWTGTTSTAWNTSTNWSPSGVPTASDNVIIPSAPANQPLVSGITTAVCNNLTVNAGATLTISATTTNNSTLTSSGTATINGALSIGGWLSKIGKLVVVNITWGSTSSMSGYYNGRIDVSGNWEFATGSAVSMGYCNVYFVGSTNSSVISKSSSSSFTSVTNNKNSGYNVTISSTSTSSLRISGSLILNSGTKFYGEANITTILENALTNSGNFYFNAGTVSMEQGSGIQNIQVNSGDYFNSLKINGGSTVTLNNNVYIHDDLTIQAGTFDPANYTVYVTGDWINTAGPDHFIEGTGKVVFYLIVNKNGGKAFENYCNYTENFNILEVYNEGGYLIINSASAVITCNQYDYTAGGVKVQAGTFTALDLADPGIFGYFGVQTGGTINLTNNGDYIDLSGALNITGGNLNVYGGLDQSYWPYNNNASITMSGGVLDFVDKGINIASSTFLLTSNITGGTIRTSGDFTNYRTDFTPTAGTVELYGSEITGLAMNAGNLRNLSVTKTSDKSVTLTTNATVNGDLTLNSGTFWNSNRILTVAGNISINNTGILSLGSSSQLLLANGMVMNVNNGGTLKVIGSTTTPATISHTSGYYYIWVNTGGTLAAKYASFQYLNNLILGSGSIIDPFYNLDYCSFGNTSNTYLIINNDQTLTIRGANFSTLPPSNNVSKGSNVGRITFKDATGAFAGAAYEYDPYNRIDWVSSQPGLWTGLASTSWTNPSNWDDLTVPTSATNVTIPSGAPNMPGLVLGTVTCNNMVCTGTLTIRSAIMQVGGNLTMNGTLAMNNTSGQLQVTGNVNWNSGSAASITADAAIDVYGNWTFNSGTNVALEAGSVNFKGTSSKSIYCYSNTSSFWNLLSGKTGGAAIEFSSLSTQPLHINNSFTTDFGSKFISSSYLSIELKGNVISHGIIQCNAGSFELTGTSHSIMPNVNDYFNSIIFRQSGTTSINNSYTNTLTLKGGMTFYSGVLAGGNNIIKIGSDWNRQTSSDVFNEGTSRVIFNGSGDQMISNNETYNVMEVNKTAGSLIINGATVTCNIYDWSLGGVRVANGGMFTITDLADNGIYGYLEVQSGSTINLYQDVSQNVNLGGNITIIENSSINIYGGNGWSQWPYGANASIHMTDGTLDFKNQGININSTAPYSLTTDITGGTIRTATGFFCNRTDFNPAGGTLELYGPNTANLEVPAGSLRNLTINKPMPVYLLSDATINGVININDGTLKATNRVISTGDHINVNDGGTLWLENGAVLKVTGNKALTINQGGLLKVFGTPASKPVITRNGETPAHEFHVNGTISAKNAIFEHSYGICISVSGLIDPVYPLDSCTFQNGIGKYIDVINTQDIVIRAANFANTSTGGNVWKYNVGGHITFKDATGPFAGPSYEYDPYNQIDWSASEPGLWTGLVSTDWHTAGNWDDLHVPTSSTDVTIPTVAPNMPVISSSNAFCNTLYLDGNLTIQNRTLTVSGNANISGILTMNNYLGKMEVLGDISWKDGSSANITANAYIIIFGNWIFNSGSTADLTNCSISFNGTVSKKIYSNSTTSSFGDVYISKTGGASVSLQATSTEAMRTKGFFVDMNSHFISNSSHDIIVRANFYSFSLTELNAGAVVFNGNNHLIIPHQDAFMNNLVFNQTGTVTINQTNTNILTVKGDLTISSGIFSPGNSVIKLGGSWYNTFGTGAFDEGTSRVIFNGNSAQFCSSEEFNILEVDKTLGNLYLQDNDVITCQTYDWTAGGLWIAGMAGFYANDLADNGISGFIHLFEGNVELHQDGAQSVDPSGELRISGGVFKVFGGSGQSNWGTYANGILTMTGGVLDFVDQGIVVREEAPYTFAAAINGGTIRTQRSFMVQSAVFNPSHGTVELYGDQNSSVRSENGGSFWNVDVTKSSSVVRVSFGSSLIKNNLTIDEGLAEVPFGQVVECRGSINVNTGGWLAVTSGTMRLGNLSSININNSGLLTSEGYEGAPSVFTSNYPSAYYSFNINSGAELIMYHSIVEKVSEQGLFIAPGANISSSRTFESCEFRNGKSGSNPLLTINNSQDLVIESAIFPENIWGSQYNVRKSVDAGSVTFIEATGAFAGETFEADPYGRIHWVTTRTLNLSSLFLEGLYDGLGTMRQAFDENGPHWQSGIADEIIVELHNAYDYSIVEFAPAGLYLTTSGTATVEIPFEKNDFYYITIKHRNSIETVSALPVDFSASVVNYAFDTPDKAYGNNLGMMIDGTSVIFTGDSNRDQIIDGGDLSDIANLADLAEMGYIPEDLNGDGLIDATDLSLAGNNADIAIGAILP